MKKIITLGIVLLLSLNFVACKSNETTNIEQTQAPTETTTETKSADEIAKEYTDKLTMLEGETFSVDLTCEKNGIYTSTQEIINSKNGCLYWEKIDDYLVTADLDSNANKLTFNSYKITDTGVEKVGSIDIEDLIVYTDELNILFSNLELNNGKKLIMIESRSFTYTFGDGVDYSIDLLELTSSGKLNSYFSDELAGSGDADITKTIRAGFNNATSLSCNQDQFENAFYDGNMLTETLNLNTKASIEYISEAAKKYYETNDFTATQEITNQVSSTINSGAVFKNWGTGSFNNFCN